MPYILGKTGNPPPEKPEQRAIQPPSITPCAQQSCPLVEPVDNRLTPVPLLHTLGTDASLRDLPNFEKLLG